MSNHDIQEKDEGIEVARRMAEEEEGIGRRPQGLPQYVIPFIAVLWSFFQLSIASWLILDSTFIRAFHLGFALLIVFLNYPLFKKTRFGLHLLHPAFPGAVRHAEIIAGCQSQRVSEAPRIKSVRAVFTDLSGDSFLCPSFP